MSNYGPWVTATVASGDVLSDAVDLKENYDSVTILHEAVLAPTNTIGLSVSWDGTTYVPLHAMDTDATGSADLATTTGTAAKAIVLYPCGGVQFVKVRLGAGTAGDASFKVRGC